MIRSIRASAHNSRLRLVPLLALTVTMASAAIALAVVGLQNASFEQGLDNWTTYWTRDDGSGNRVDVYAPGTAPCNQANLPQSREGICVVEGTDTFEVSDAHGLRNVAVSPVDGSKMLRISGPFNNSGQRQSEDRLSVGQTFTVDPSNPVLQVNFNIFTFDYSGFDEAEFRVALTSVEDSTPIASRVVGSFGPGGDTTLKSTGWRPVQFDLTDFAGQQVHMRIRSGGTSDSLYGFWTYVDAGVLPPPPVDAQSASATPSVTQTPPPFNKPVVITEQYSPESGLKFFQVQNSTIAQLGGCLGMTISVPINPGAGTLSEVTLLHAGEPPEINMSKAADPSNIWSATIPCIAEGPLNVSYNLTEEGKTYSYIIPIGGIQLTDPRGVVYDQATFNTLKSQGASDDDARAGAAISGAQVVLQRSSGGSAGPFAKVPSGDPGISPNVNPEFTGADGIYAWDVSDGFYRVRVTKSGYVPVISRVVQVPPIVLDLHVGLPRIDTTIAGGPANGSTVYSGQYTFTLGSNDSDATFQCKLDGGSFAPCQSQHPVNVAKGQHTLTVRATGPISGTDATPATRTWTYTDPPAETKPTDTTAPVVRITSGPAKRTRSRKATFKFRSEAGAKFACKLDSQRFKPCKSPKTYRNLRVGRHTFKVRATDAAGNVSRVASRSWKILRRR